MPSDADLRALLPVRPPCLLFFAPSVRAPDYETQENVLDGASDETRRRLPVVVRLLMEGESFASEQRIDPDAVRRLRSHLGIGEADFKLVVIDANGRVSRTFDSPTKAAVLADAAGMRASAS